MSSWDLTSLLNAADPRASLPERHLWWVRLLEWLRHGPQQPGRMQRAKKAAGQGRVPPESAEPFEAAQAAQAAKASSGTPAPVLRLRQLAQVLERHEAHRLRVQQLMRLLLQEADAVSLLVDFGLAPRNAFGSELAGRLRAKLLPGASDTRNGAELFALVFRAEDAHWLARLDAPTRARLAALCPPLGEAWRAALMDAITMLCSAVRAAGFSSALRLRMGTDVRAVEPFRQLARAADSFSTALRTGDAAERARAQRQLQRLLAQCRAAADAVLEHLEEYGVSLHIVFDVDQLRLRTRRVEQLMGYLLSQGDDAAEVQRLLLEWAETLRRSRSVRALLREESRLLSRQVAERHAETGEHYITRTAPEYRAMLRAALGGGAVIAGTTWAKFGLAALGLSAFWGGVAAGLNYALSFVIVMLMHWTVATKQPAMTAPAMAAKLAELEREEGAPAPFSDATGAGLADDGHPAESAAIEGFVDEVAHLIRSQFAGIIGNLAMCFPLVLLVQLLSLALAGAPLIGPAKAHEVLDSLNLLGPTAIFAAFTGVLLFASSLVAGWVENAFVFHRLHSALRWNPWMLARVGASRAQRWADWWRTHISGLAASVSLGLMLGLVPVLLQFVGIPLDVRHVTLSSGQLAVALGALGWQALYEPAFWWCAAAVPVIGVLNLSVSFALAFRVALRARAVRVGQRAQIYRSIARRLRRSPLSFLRPAPALAAAANAGGIDSGGGGGGGGASGRR